MITGNTSVLHVTLGLRSCGPNECPVRPIRLNVNLKMNAPMMHLRTGQGPAAGHVPSNISHHEEVCNNQGSNQGCRRKSATRTRPVASLLTRGIELGYPTNPTIANTNLNRKSKSWHPY
jgi:hypothetical protein